MKDIVKGILEIGNTIIQNMDETDEMSSKELAIVSILDENNIEYIFDKEIGIIVPNEDKFETIIDSHIDLIPQFNKFATESSTPFQLEKGDIIGPLDNNITNISLLHNLINEDLTSSCVFSRGEESGMWGFKKFIEKYKSEFPKNVTMMVLDVTNEAYETNISIECDLMEDKDILQFKLDSNNIKMESYKKLKNEINNIPDERIIEMMIESKIKPNVDVGKALILKHKLNAIVEKGDYAFTTEREGDHTDVILEYNQNKLEADPNITCISYCIPTDNNMHSLLNTTTETKLEVFTNKMIDTISMMKDREYFKRVIEFEVENVDLSKSTSKRDLIKMTIQEELGSFYYHSSNISNQFSALKSIKGKAIDDITTYTIKTNFSDEIFKIIVDTKNIDSDQLKIDLKNQCKEIVKTSIEASDFQYIDFDNETINKNPLNDMENAVLDIVTKAHLEGESVRVKNIKDDSIDFRISNGQEYDVKKKQYYTTYDEPKYNKDDLVNNNISDLV